MLTYITTASGFCVTAIAASDNTIVAEKSHEGSCGKLTAQYFNNNSLTGPPSVTRIDPSLDFNWGFGSPAQGVDSDSISGSWTGFITAPVTGAYTMRIWEDDGSRIYLNGALVADHWSDACCTWRTFTYNFTAGQKVPFKAEFAEGGGVAGIRLHWSYPGQGSTPVPGSAFSI